MTVQELINKLNRLPKTAVVLVEVIDEEGKTTDYLTPRVNHLGDQVYLEVELGS